MNFGFAIFKQKISLKLTSLVLLLE
jgi:hypothetical protein